MDPWTDGAQKILERSPMRATSFSQLLAVLEEEGLEVRGREAWILRRLSEHPELFRVLPDHGGPFRHWLMAGNQEWAQAESRGRIGNPWVLACPAPPPGFGAGERTVRRIQEGLRAWGCCLDEGSPRAVARWVRANREAEGSCALILTAGAERP